jgi:hypothetical protein
MAFAKIYGGDTDQILVLIDSGDSGPEVRLYFEPDGLGVCNVSLKYADTDDGWDRAEAAFNAITESDAKAIVAQAMEQAGVCVPQGASK